MIKRIKHLVLGIMFLVTLSTTTKAYANGWDFLDGDLRTDLPEIVNAGDYRVKIRASAIPAGYPDDFTAGWLSIDLNNQPNIFGRLFTQVGVITYPDGPHWFVYAESGIICLRGQYKWWSQEAQMYLGCLGDVWDIVSIGTYHYVELVKYPLDDFWIARVNYVSGAAIEVAKILSSNSVIYNATATMEEGYAEAYDPHLIALFTFKNPEYLTYSGFQV